MNAIDKVKELVTTMTEQERKACLEVFSKSEHETEVLIRNIQSNLKKLKAGFAGLTMDDWGKFCGELQDLSSAVKQTWVVIDRHRQLDNEARAAKRKEYRA